MAAVSPSAVGVAVTAIAAGVASCAAIRPTWLPRPRTAANAPAVPSAARRVSLAGKRECWDDIAVTPWSGTRLCPRRRHPLRWGQTEHARRQRLGASVPARNWSTESGESRRAQHRATRDLDEGHAHRRGGGIVAVGHVELAENAGDMALNGPRTEEERLGDLPIGLSGGNEAQHLVFTGGERIGG